MLLTLDSFIPATFEPPAGFSAEPYWPFLGPSYRRASFPAELSEEDTLTGWASAGEPCGFLEEELIWAEGTAVQRPRGGGSKLGVSPGHGSEGETGDDSKKPVGSQLAPPIVTQSPFFWEAVLASHLLMPCSHTSAVAKSRLSYFVKSASAQPPGFHLPIFHDTPPLLSCHPPRDLQVPSPAAQLPGYVLQPEEQWGWQIPGSPPRGLRRWHRLLWGNGLELNWNE